ncbi:MAG TPA: cytochrome C [Candidatus Brocadiia bacterium]|nr:cytochrome C [Planctomycetota bacterium]MDO8094385.1 cytochrome C [Candidatus Brocadiales bacterium]
MPEEKVKKEEEQFRLLAVVEEETLSKARDIEVGDTVNTWPYLVRKELLVAIGITIGLIVWALISDAPLEEYANPNVTPNPSKAPWYFAGLQEMLVYFDPWIAGVALPMLIVFGLMAIPYLDINPKGRGYYTFRERIFAVSTFCFGFIVLWITLILVGVFLRGPGWILFWPWQEWNIHRIVAETNYDLTQFFGINSKSFTGMVLAAVVVFLYYLCFMGIPYCILRKGSAFATLGIIRYLIVSFLFATMMALPIKIILRLTVHMKYVWVTPWFNI